MEVVYWYTVERPLSWVHRSASLRIFLPNQSTAEKALRPSELEYAHISES